ncbi:SH2 domain-containing adapter protein F isoform X2 [Caretta caretta]|uniref:SH2 domain-containing adapter protein F isoform X2 n=1 Tax=Caretta caretta TaxID=8467 RepID=UPI003F4AF869
MLLSGAAAGSERAGPGPGHGPGPGGAPQCVGSMARWLREHLGFRSAKPAPPAPPKPDYRAGLPQPPPPPGGAPAAPLCPAAAQPDILAAYKLQRDRDFEDPYTGAGPGGLAPDARYGSPKHRLIKVDAAEKAPEEPAPEQVIVLEDYADPFDAKQAASCQPGQEKVAENDGYMEPYEAQKMMAEIRLKGSLEAPAQPLPLYDTPYEPVPNGLPPDSERPSCARPRESRLPQDDERPPEEYDQPWEWKKERISKAFAGHCEGPGHGHSSPSREEKARTANRHVSGNPKTEPSPALGERINPTLPLESQCWYHGAISRTDAETLLRLCKEASYLVRNSETSKNDFSLSLKSSQGFMHMKLSRTQENKYVLGQNSPLFDSVPKIIHHYTSHKLPIKGAEHMSLLYPVAIRTL